MIRSGWARQERGSGGGAALSSERIPSRRARTGRVAWAKLASVGVLWCAVSARAGAEPAAPGPAARSVQVRLVADWDDDDGDGMPDAEQAVVGDDPDLIDLPAALDRSRNVRPPSQGPDSRVRLRVDGRAWSAGGASLQPGARLTLQGIRPGRTSLRFAGLTLQAHVIGVIALDAAGRPVDLARSHASLERSPPREIPPEGGTAPAVDDDLDALHYVLVGAPGDLPATVKLESRSARGDELGSLEYVPLTPTTCPAGTEPALACVRTAPIRLAADVVDAAHPSAAGRSVVAELGGAVLLLDRDGRKLQQIRVGGPRRLPGAQAGIARLRAHLRVWLVRLSPAGAAPIGANDDEALRATREALARANAIWGGCGVSFGPPDAVQVRLVDPPPPHLLAVGCQQGLPASGGRIEVRWAGRTFGIDTSPGLLPAEVARRMAAALERGGLQVRVADNPPSGAAALGTTDLSVRFAGGRLAALEPAAAGPVSTDATLDACIGHVELGDGIEHFGDVDAVAGTLEERALIAAYDDGDPRTIEVFVVPGFGRGGRIGESFIGSDGGPIRNVVLVDGAGLRASRASYALAHELGHVLLDDPGHADDYGMDTPTRLMDADAADASAFGPTRLSLQECAEVMRQSGPASPAPLLEPWPFEPLELP